MKTGDRINAINAGMMLASCAAAYAVPFQLFLFSYAVLGPLHYLTEISWLHDRGYFVRAVPPGRDVAVRRTWLALVAVTLAIMLAGLLAERFGTPAFSPAVEIALVCVVFATAWLVATPAGTTWWAAPMTAVALAAALAGAWQYVALAAFLLITIVHVLVFTVAFVVYGALKSRSHSGFASLAVFGTCALSFFVVMPGALGPGAEGYVRDSYAPFAALNAQLIRVLGLGGATSLAEIYHSTQGLVVMRLIAFAYTYHYLNWFSKTSIIKWHEVSKRRAAAIAVLWAAALALYGFSYAAGFVALYVLSVLHVLLEFPLNHQTFGGIGRELVALVMRRRLRQAVPRA